MYIEDNKTPQLKEAIDNVVRVYKSAGFKVATMFGDMEFKKLDTYIQDKHQATLNCANANDHVPEAENNNKVIKERTRVRFHAQLFKAIPAIMTKYLVTESCKKLNFSSQRRHLTLFQSQDDSSPKSPGLCKRLQHPTIQLRCGT